MDSPEFHSPQSAPPHIFFAVILSAIGILIFGLYILKFTDADVNMQIFTISNNRPVIESVTVSDQPQGAAMTLITPAEKMTHVVYVRGVAHDASGCGDIDDPSQWSAVLHHSQAEGGANCAADSRMCYKADPATQLTLSGCSDSNDTDIEFAWAIPMQYYALPTDNGESAAAEWRARVAVNDAEDAMAEASTGFEVASLRAMEIQKDINYGVLSLGKESIAQAVEVMNTGNQKLDLFIKGLGPLQCDVGTVPLENTYISLTDAFDPATTMQLSDIDTPLNISLPPRTDTEPKRTIYFKLKVPSTGLSGDCQNSISFTAKVDE